MTFKKNEQSQLKLYNLNLEQEKNLSTIHAFTFSKRNVASEELRSAEPKLATLVKPFYHSVNPLVKKQLNQLYL